MITKVRDLQAGRCITYTLPPREAVVCAWYQGQGNWNVWEYDYEHAPVEQTEHSITCGNFCAPLEGGKP